MATPEFESTEQAGYGASVPRDGGHSVDNMDRAGRTDDVSFAKSIGVDHTSDALDKVKDVAQRGMESAGDAMNQLQSKASEITSNLINKVDIDDLTARLETEVREHPARTLMVAAAAGFLLGRAVKR